MSFLFIAIFLVRRWRRWWRRWWWWGGDGRASISVIHNTLDGIFRWTGKTTTTMTRMWTRTMETTNQKKNHWQSIIRFRCCRIFVDFPWFIVEAPRIKLMGRYCWNDGQSVGRLGYVCHFHCKCRCVVRLMLKSHRIRRNVQVSKIEVQSIDRGSSTSIAQCWHWCCRVLQWFSASGHTSQSWPKIIETSNKWNE